MNEWFNVTGLFIVGAGLGVIGHIIGKRQAAGLTGVSEREMRRYIKGDKTCPYSIQFALECLAEDSED